MTKSIVLTISDHFKDLNDPRRTNRRHKLLDIITIAICAVICSADNFEHIYEKVLDLVKKFN